MDLKSCTMLWPIRSFPGTKAAFDIASLDNGTCTNGRPGERHRLTELLDDCIPSHNIRVTADEMVMAEQECANRTRDRQHRYIGKNKFWSNPARAQTKEQLLPILRTQQWLDLTVDKGIEPCVRAEHAKPRPAIHQRVCGERVGEDETKPFQLNRVC